LRNYYWPGGHHRERGVGALHQEIWIARYGPIPPAHHIHHRDENPLNNDISNLEAKLGREHNREHSSSEENKARFRLVQPLGLEKAAAWHRTEAGRELARRNGKLVMSLRVAVE